MTDLAATKAIFVDHKPLQSRSVGRLIFEVPIEQYDAALGALGGTPLPGESRWFAIARLTKQPTGHEIVGSAPSPSLADAADSPAAASKPKRPWHKYSPSQQAGMACKDAIFLDWLENRRMRTPSGGVVFCQGKPGPEFAASVIRELCGVSSRSELDTNPEAAKRWRELFGMFQADTQYGERR